MRGAQHWWGRGVMVLALLATMPGCIGLMANLIHAGWGNLVPARYDQLAGKKVAVICLSANSSFGNSAAADAIALRVERSLRQRIPEITMIDQQAIGDWMDRNDWNEIDYRELGQGVGAEQLIAIELRSFSLHDGPTLFKGRANVGFAVHDITSGTVPYRIEPQDVEFPQNGGQHSADTTEEEFRARFLDVMASRVARHFHSYDVKEDFGRDPTFVAP